MLTLAHSHGQGTLEIASFLVFSSSFYHIRGHLKIGSDFSIMIRYLNWNLIFWFNFVGQLMALISPLVLAIVINFTLLMPTSALYLKPQCNFIENTYRAISKPFGKNEYNFGQHANSRSSNLLEWSISESIVQARFMHLKSVKFVQKGWCKQGSLTEFSYNSQISD